MNLSSVNPFTLKTIATYPLLGAKVEKKKLQLAQKAQISWQKESVSERTRYLPKIAELLNTHKNQFAQLISDEMGKPLVEAILEIEKCATVCSYYESTANAILADKLIETNYSKSWIKHEPLGIVLGIMPWNFPFWQVFRFAIPTLIAGNAVVLKHASNVLGCAEAIAQIFTEAELPAGLFQAFNLSNRRTEQLIENKYINAISLTGSVTAGSRVASIAGKALKKCVLELGGSNAFLVFPDADIDLAVNSAIKGRFSNAGQSCIAAKRFLLHKDIADEFTQKFIKQAKELRVGNPSDKNTQIGPLARIDLSEKLEAQINKSIKRGAILSLGGKRNNNLVEPTILTHVKPGMAAFDEETFGPLAALVSCESEKEMIQLANQTPFGLGVSLFSKDTERMINILGEFKDGAVFINDIVKSDAKLPFGGTGKSGYGRELGAAGLCEFVNIKTIVIS